MEKLFKAVKTDGAFFFILAILNLPIILQAFVGNTGFLPSAEKFFHYAEQFFCLTTIIFIMTLLINFGMAKKKKLKKFLQRALIGIFSATCAAEFYYLSRFKRDFDIEAAEIFVENLLEPIVLIGTIIFAVLLVIGIQDLQKIFKTMSTKKIRVITYAIIIISVMAIISLFI